jgi:hypothetical protein
VIGRRAFERAGRASFSPLFKVEHEDSRLSPAPPYGSAAVVNIPQQGAAISCVLLIAARPLPFGADRAVGQGANLSP